MILAKKHAVGKKVKMTGNVSDRNDTRRWTQEPCMPTWPLTVPSGQYAKTLINLKYWSKP